MEPGKGMEAGEGMEFMTRTVVQPKRSGLALFAAISGAIALAWLWIGIAAALAGGLSQWIVFPVSAIAAGGFSFVCWWALRRRSNEEPALIIDEVGLFDNVSAVHAGRVKWRETERVWIAGPSWMPFLCVLPDDLRAYLEGQDDAKGVLMRFNKAIMGAPVVIPFSVLDMPQEDIWHRISQVAGASREPFRSSNFVAGA